MSVPDVVRKQIRQQLSSLADELGWMSLPLTEKRKLYEDWTSDPKYGGTLAKYIDKGQVRVYLKDTILKDYTRAAGADPSRPLRLLKIPPDVAVAQTYIKPHGRRLADGRVICWGRASDWKLVLMAMHERSSATKNAVPFAAILGNATGKFADAAVRGMVEDAATKLTVQKLLWL
jgi:hypothetical protein